MAAFSGEALPVLWTGTAGYLRRSVQVERGNDSWRLRYSIWEISIPASVVDGDPNFRAFLERQRPLRDVQTRYSETQNLINLLLAQGCTTIDGTKSTYSMDEVRHIVQAMTAQWYGAYYSHPIWPLLRGCRLSLSQLFAWVLRTYHLSRSAGPTAARGAISSPNQRIREAFLKSSIEEYSHCEIYYCPVHDRFGLQRDWVINLLPSPSSLAFDQHMSIIAEDDWIAHALSAYFQEYTAAFRENAFALYDCLEFAYKLDGFFKGWKDHIGYDLDQTHADDFIGLFSGNDKVDRRSLLGSIEAASATVEFLIGSLDELIGMKPDTPLNALRVPPALLSHDIAETTVIGGIEFSRSLLRTRDHREMIEVLIRYWRNNFDDTVTRWIANDCLPVQFLAENTTRALSFATGHDEVLLLGDYLERFHRNRTNSSESF